MRRRATWLLAGFALLLGAPWSAPAAAAPVGVDHPAPQYVTSDPERGAKLHEAPEEVRVTFSELLDPSSTLAVFDECDRKVDTGEVEVFANEMRVALEKGPSGRYDVRYSATGLGGLSGTTKDSFSFSVHMGKSCDGGGRGHRGHGDEPPGGGQHPAGHGSGGDNGSGEHGSMAPGGSGAHSASGAHGDQADHGAAHVDGSVGTGGGAGHHDGRKHKAGHANHGQDPDAGASDDAPPPLAGGETTTPADPDPDAVGLGLVLVVTLGALGGWLLRVAGS